MSNREATPLVTIALPTYNRAKTFFPIALSSARNQSYENLDILVSDNASSDETQDFVSSLRDPRIRYHRHAENVGAARNFNFCIQQGRGSHFLLLMDDDVIDQDLVEICMAERARQPDVGLIRTGTRVIDGAGEVLYESPNRAAGLSFADFLCAWMSHLTSPYLCSTIFRTDLLQRVGLHSKHNLWCDVVSELKIMASDGRADIEAVKASFRMHAGEMTALARQRDWCEDSLELLDLMCELAPERAPELRVKGLEFLALFNYRNAVHLKGTWGDRLGACFAVQQVFGRRPPLRFLARETLRQTEPGRWLRRQKRRFAR